MKKSLILLFLYILTTQAFSQALTIKVKNIGGTEIDEKKNLCKDEKVKLFVSDNKLTETKYIWTGPNLSNSTLAEPEIELKGDNTQKYAVTISGILTTGTTTANTTLTGSFTTKILEKPEIKEIKSYVENGSLFLRYSNNLDGVNYKISGPNITPVTTTQKIYEFQKIRVDQFGEFKLTVESDNKKYCEYIYTISTTVNDVENKKEEKQVFGLAPQEDDTKVYILKGKVPFKKSDYEGKILENSPLFPYFNSKFTVVNEIDNDLIINFNSFYKTVGYIDNSVKSKQTVLQRKFREDNENNPIFFRVSKKEINDANKVRKFYSVGRNSLAFTAATVILPVKLRYPKKGGEHFDFSKDITLGPFVGMRTRISHYNPFFLNVGVNVGISAVTLDKSNAFIKLESTNSDLMNKIDSKNSIIEKPVDLAAFTHSFGVIFEYDKVQLGIFRGRDRISELSGYNWIYNNKPWWSIGIGYSIISRPASRKQSAPNNGDVDK